MHDLRTGDRAFIRELNTAIVLDCIRQHEPIARAQIAMVTGMGRSTVSGIVAVLQESGLVTSAGAAPSTGGRKADLLTLATDRFFAVGIKLEPTHIRASLTDLKGRIVSCLDAPNSTSDLNETLASLDSIYRQLTQHMSPASILGVGVALPGLVHSGEGISIHPHYFDWRNVRLRDHLEAMWGLPVWIENDARAGALGEKWADQRAGLSTYLFVTVGVGIGAGVVVDGNLLEGGLVGAGHLGHTTVVPDGLPCHCGLRGCLETVANDQALLRYANAAGSRVYLSPLEVFEEARARDRAALDAVGQVARYLALSVGNVVKVLGMSRVVLGGESAVAGGSLLINPLREALNDYIFTETKEQVAVSPSRLGNDVWMVGAAALVLEALYRPPIYSGANRLIERVVRAQ